MARYGSREVADVVLKDIATGKPVLYLETLKVTNLEGTAETTYATGGKGNPRRVAWNSNKEVTFNMEDGLVSPESLAILLGDQVKKGAKIIHKKEVVTVEAGNTVTLAEVPAAGKPIFVFSTQYGYDIGEDIEHTLTEGTITLTAATEGDKVIVDYYYESGETTQTMTVLSDKFPGYYMLEASTLWRNEETGKDYEAVYTMPKVKLQPDFTLENANEGDPVSFNFVVDAFPNSDGEMVIIDILT